jgi:hypothetical protein
MSFDPEELQIRVSHGASGWMMSRQHGLYLGTPAEHVRLVMQVEQLKAFADSLSSVARDVYGIGEAWHSLNLPPFVAPILPLPLEHDGS